MQNLQSIKDTFYALLQSRLATLNPARTLVVRGILRPGILVPENELPGTAIDGISPAEAFCLRWATLKVDAQTAGSLLTLGCEIRYASDGTTGNASMDRGRMLSAMDVELATALTLLPMHTIADVLSEAPGGGASTIEPLSSNIFWTQPTFGALIPRGERLERTAQLEVFGYGQ